MVQYFSNMTVELLPDRKTNFSNWNLRALYILSTIIHFWFRLLFGNIKLSFFATIHWQCSALTLFVSSHTDRLIFLHEIVEDSDRLPFPFCPFRSDLTYLPVSAESSIKEFIPYRCADQKAVSIIHFRIMVCSFPIAGSNLYFLSFWRRAKIIWRSYLQSSCMMISGQMTSSGFRESSSWALEQPQGKVRDEYWGEQS